MFGTHQFHHVTGVDHGLGQYRYVDTCPFDAANADTVHKFQGPDGADFFSGNRFAGDHNG
jgi:hypothetical protein